MSLEGQELALSRERESNLRSEVSRLQVRNVLKALQRFGKCDFCLALSMIV